MRTQAARRRSLARLWPGALGLGLLGVAACAQAAPTPLDAYLDNLKTLRADFCRRSPMRVAARSIARQAR
jgi:hypothetical protein